MRPRIDERRNAKGEVYGYQVRWWLRPGRGAPSQAKSFRASEYDGDLAAAQTAADRFLIEHAAAFQSGRATDELRFGALPLRQYLVEQYWRFNIPTKVRSRQSQKVYRRFIVSLIEPAFGHMRLCDLTFGTLSRWLTLLGEPCAERGAQLCAACERGEPCTLALPPSQHDNLVTVLWSICGFAYRCGHILQNPAARLEKSEGRRERESTRVERFREDAVEPVTIEYLRLQMDPSDALYVLLRYVMLVRPAEAFALCFDDLLNEDLSGKDNVLIAKTVDPTTKPPSIRDLTKTRQDRWVQFADLCPRLVEEVVAEYQRRDVQLSASVFPKTNGDGGWWSPQLWHTERWLPAMRRAGLGSPGAASYFWPYLLRSTGCTLWSYDRRGLRLAELARQAGNSPSTLERHYLARFRRAARYRNKTLDEIVREAQKEAAAMPAGETPERTHTADPVEVERLALTGRTYSDIAADVGISSTKVSNIMASRGYRKVREGRAWRLLRSSCAATQRDDLADAILADALEEGLGVRAIMAKRHIAAKRVTETLAAAGWRRTRGRDSRWRRADAPTLVPPILLDWRKGAEGHAESALVA